MPPEFVSTTGGGMARDAAHLATGVPMYVSGMLSPSYLGQPVIHPRMRAIMPDARSLAAPFVAEERCYDVLGVLMTHNITDPPVGVERSARWHSGWNERFHPHVVCAWEDTLVSMFRGDLRLVDALTHLLSSELCDRTRILRAFPEDVRRMLRKHAVPVHKLYRPGSRLAIENDDVVSAKTPPGIDATSIPYGCLHVSQVPPDLVRVLSESWRTHKVMWAMAVRVLVAETVHLSPFLWDEKSSRHWAFMFQITHARMYMHLVERIEGFGVAQDMQHGGSSGNLPVDDVVLMADPLYGVVVPNWRRAIDAVHLPSLGAMIWDINMWVVTEVSIDEMIQCLCKLWRKMNPHVCAMRDLKKIIKEVMGECPQMMHLLLDMFLIFIGGAYEGSSPMFFYKWVWWQENVSAMGFCELDDFLTWVADHYLILHLMMRIFISINVAGMPSIARLLGESYRDPMMNPNPSALRTFLYKSMDSIRFELCSKEIGVLHIGNLVHMHRADDTAKRALFLRYKDAMLEIMGYLQKFADARKESGLVMNTGLVRALPCQMLVSIVSKQLKAVYDSPRLAFIPLEEIMRSVLKGTYFVTEYISSKEEKFRESLSKLWSNYTGCTRAVSAFVSGYVPFAMERLCAGNVDELVLIYEHLAVNAPLPREAKHRMVPNVLAVAHEVTCGLTYLSDLMCPYPDIFQHQSERARLIAKEVVNVSNDKEVCGAIRMYASYAALHPGVNPRFDLLIPLVGKEIADVMMMMYVLDVGDGRALNAMDQDIFPLSVTDPVRLTVVNIYLVTYNQICARTVRPLSMTVHLAQLRALAKRYSLEVHQKVQPEMGRLLLCGCNAPSSSIVYPYGPPDKVPTIGSRQVAYDRSEGRIVSTHSVARPECGRPITAIDVAGYLVTGVGSKRRAVSICVRSGAFVVTDMSMWMGGPYVGPYAQHRVARFERTAGGPVLEGKRRTVDPYRKGDMIMRVVPRTNGTISPFTSMIGIYLMHALLRLYPHDMEAGRKASCGICRNIFGMKECEVFSHGRTFYNGRGYVKGFLCNSCDESVIRFERRHDIRHGFTIDIPAYQEYMATRADEDRSKAIKFNAKRIRVGR